MRRKRRATAGAQADEPKEKRTFSPVVVLLLVLIPGVVGLVLFIFLGATGTTPTEQVISDDSILVTSSTVTTVDAGLTTTSTPLVFSDGSPVPERIVEVARGPGESTYVYAVAPELTGSDAATVVPPTHIELANDGSALSVSMLCAISQESAPSRISVVEDPLEVRVTTVAAGRRLGAPCQPLQVIETIVIPLDAPIGDRGLVITAAGSPVAG
jgi:hypothetical protein